MDEKKFDTLTKNVAKILDRMEAQDKKAAETEKKIDSVMELMKRVTDVEKHSKLTDEKVNKLTARCSDLESLTDISSKRLDKVEAGISKSVKRLNEEIKHLTSRLDQAEKVTDDAIETGTRIRNLRVSQIPLLPNEDLGQVVSKIFTFIGRQMGRDLKFYRLKSGASKDTIILNFVNEFEKERFFEQYLGVAKQMVASKFVNIDASKEANVYVSHDLCQAQYKINKAIMKIKGSVVKRIRIQRGYVHIQLEEGKPFLRILTLEMLHKIIEHAKKN